MHVPAATSQAARLIVSKDFVPGPWRLELSATDWGLIVLDDALSIRPVAVKPVTPAQLQQGSSTRSFSQIGYGVDRPYLPSIVRNCRIDQGPSDKVLIYRCLTNSGYSGAPLFAEVDGEPFIIGIGSGSNKKQGVGIACAATQFAAPLAELMQASQSK